MTQILIVSAKLLFPTLCGYILHPIFILEAVQAISNTGNAFQQILRNAFCGIHFVEKLSCKSNVIDVQCTPYAFQSKKVTV